MDRCEKKKTANYERMNDETKFGRKRKQFKCTRGTRDEENQFEMKINARKMSFGGSKFNRLVSFSTGFCVLFSPLDFAVFTLQSECCSCDDIRI